MPAKLKQEATSEASSKAQHCIKDEAPKDNQKDIKGEVNSEVPEQAKQQVKKEVKEEGSGTLKREIKKETKLEVKTEADCYVPHGIVVSIACLRLRLCDGLPGCRAEPWTLNCTNPRLCVLGKRRGAEAWLNPQHWGGALLARIAALSLNHSKKSYIQFPV